MKILKKFTQKSVNKKPAIKKIKQLRLDTILEKYNVSTINYLNIDVRK